MADNEETRNNLLDLLARISSMEEEEESSPLPEAQIMDLYQFLPRFTSPCPYKVGDLVTPNRQSNLRDDGKPHLVVEVLDNPERVFEGSKAGTGVHGARYNIRVINITQGMIVAHWLENWMLDPYTGPRPD